MNAQNLAFYIARKILETENRNEKYCIFYCKKWKKEIKYRTKKQPA